MDNVWLCMTLKKARSEFFHRQPRWAHKGGICEIREVQSRNRQFRGFLWPCRGGDRVWGRESGCVATILSMASSALVQRLLSQNVALILSTSSMKKCSVCLVVIGLYRHQLDIGAFPSVIIQLNDSTERSPPFLFFLLSHTHTAVQPSIEPPPLLLLPFLLTSLSACFLDTLNLNLNSASPEFQSPACSHPYSHAAYAVNNPREEGNNRSMNGRC